MRSIFGEQNNAEWTQPAQPTQPFVSCCSLLTVFFVPLFFLLFLSWRHASRCGSRFRQLNHLVRTRRHRFDVDFTEKELKGDFTGQPSAKFSQWR